jgi:N-acetylglucosaminyldiphosphoundecaprenol N-acetyl-beta-D-mannosaminyltransferase
MTPKLSKSKVKLLGVRINSTPKIRLLRSVRANIYENRKFTIVTPNPEILMLAQKDRQLASILNSADIALPDAIGVVAANKFLTLQPPKNTTLRLPVLIVQGLVVGVSVIFNQKWLCSELKVIKGREMFLELIKLANKRQWRVFFLGGRGTCKKAAEVLRRNYKKVKIGYSDGPILNKDGTPLTSEDERIERDVIGQINNFKPHLLFIGFGAPKQEKWMYRWFPKLNIGGAMVVGGTFDYISGKTKLPPKWLENVGLEWFWRLVTGSQKIRRILIAFPTFPLKVFWTKWRD